MDDNDKKITEIDKVEMTINKQGDQIWWKGNKLHREDGPAIERANGTKEWHLNGKLHREDGPAVERANGTKLWYLNGKRHREDGPAIEWANGTKEWCLNNMALTELEIRQLQRNKQFNQSIEEALK